MAGRGRGATLPAWITNSTAGISEPTDAAYSLVHEKKFEDFAKTEEVINQNKITPSISPSAVSSTSLQPNSFPPIHSMYSIASAPAAVQPNFFPQIPSIHANYNQYGIMPFHVQQPQLQQHQQHQQHQPHQQQVLSSMMYNRTQASAVAPSAISDPNNDVNAWVEHSTEAGIKYWYNRVNMTSQYDKPFCLKTPEERSIPPCPWKEYIHAADGRKYYSNGKDASWTMPEEFRVHQERLQSIEQKKIAAAAAASAAINEVPAPASAVAGSRSSKASSKTEVAANQQKKADAEEKELVPVVSYATREEAMAAFSTLLSDSRVTATAKMKEVQDACEKDPRWKALKTSGERKQALAEYQTKKLKAEKEVQKAKARKFRDAYLLMLAENVEIDARTRWREAQEFLKNDPRFKNVDDSREREDLFNEFISELEKKEREDKSKLRLADLASLNELLARLSEEKLITRLSTWADCKPLIASLLPSLRAMDESGAKTASLDFIDSLELQYKSMLREEKKRLQSDLDEKLMIVKVLLESLAVSGRLNLKSKWEDVSCLPEVESCIEFKECCQMLGINSLGSSMIDAAPRVKLSGTPEEVFLDLIDEMKISWREDCRLVADILRESDTFVRYDTPFDQIKGLIYKVAGLKEASDETSVDAYGRPRQFVTEDGEEVEIDLHGPFSSKHNSSGKSQVARLRAMLMLRPGSLERVFLDMKSAEMARREEDIRRARKMEDRFVELLEEYFYRSDHVGMSYEDARRVLERHPAFDALGSSDRRRIFSQYMNSLAAKLDAKTKSMRNILEVNEPFAASVNHMPPQASNQRPGSSGAADEPDDSDGSDDEKKEKKHKKKKQKKRDRQEDHESHKKRRP